MSTDFYLACHKCKEALWIGHDGMSGYRIYSGEPECMAALQEFLWTHQTHPLEFISEHRMHDLEDDEGYKQVEWKTKPAPTSAAIRKGE